MPRLTVTITEEQSELLDDVSGDDGEYESKSEAVRNFIQTGEHHQELREKLDRLEDRLETREKRIDELEEQLARRSQLEDKIEDLPDKLRSAGSYRDRKERLIDQASPLTRLKWKFTGRPRMTPPPH
jgi:Arc/MetJ-type ribon-helix-helix transcriptional regulator